MLRMLSLFSGVFSAEGLLSNILVFLLSNIILFLFCYASYGSCLPGVDESLAYKLFWTHVLGKLQTALHGATGVMFQYIL